jgi:GNAT superfamily N-acetyltransferase
MDNITNNTGKLPLQEAEGLNLRLAKKEDCPRLMELVHELAVFEKAGDEVTVSLQEFEDAGFGNNPLWKAFVAEEDGFIAGCALCYVRYSTWKGRLLYLEDLIVTEDYRSKGIGKLLFERALKEAKEQGYSGMVWQVLDWNEPAIKFYNKYGSAIESGWLNVSLSTEEI